MRLCFFGAYEPFYPRHNVIRKGLIKNKIRVNQCWLPPSYKFWLRYPLLLLRSPFSCRQHDFLFVPEFRQKDVPLAKILSLLYSSKVVFDPLASRYETKITDWQRKPEGSWQAHWNFIIDYWSFRLSDLILADTQTHKEYYCKKYDVSPHKIAVLPVGYDDEIFKPEPKIGSKDTFTILFYGSFLPLHGVEVIIKAAEIIAKEDPSIQFRFIGSGQTLPKAKSLALEMGLSNIAFEGWICMEELPQLIASADICLGIFGKTEKAQRVVPHKIYQAMGMKKPIIAAQTPATEEFFSHGTNIFLCPEPFSDSLAQAILELKQDEALREKIAEQGYRLVKEKYSTFPLGQTLQKILKKHFRLE